MLYFIGFWNGIIVIFGGKDIGEIYVIRIANCWATYKKPTAQTVHLVFADTQSQRCENQKSCFFANARQKDEIV